MLWFLPEASIDGPCEPEILLLDVYPREMEADLPELENAKPLYGLEQPAVKA